MAAKHTPEPWECRAIGVHVYDLTNLPRRAASGETEANARRIAAAVNACVGIPTEALEGGAVAELRAACEAVAEMEGQCIYGSPELDQTCDVREAYRLGSAHAFDQCVAFVWDVLLKARKDDGSAGKEF